MALIKSKTFKNGQSASFWIITKMDINWSLRTLNLVVSPYISREQYNLSPKYPAGESEQRHWTGDDFPLDKDNSNTVGQVYTKLKESVMGPVDDFSSELEEKNFFVDAVDDF